MITHKYGQFTPEQMHETKEGLRKRIFFLLLLVDRKTAGNYEGVDVEKTFESILTEFGLAMIGLDALRRRSHFSAVQPAGANVSGI